MTTDVSILPDSEVTCDNCQACCCRLEVLLLTDIGVPGHFIEIDEWGRRTMARLDDGWCAALDRNTLLCMIYENRPLACREFEMGGYECVVRRTADL